MLMKKYIIILSFAVCCFQAHAGVIPLPKDLPTTEALMHLHKTMKRAEDKALIKLGEGKITQDEVTNKTTKFNEVRNILDSKLKNAYSYIILAGSISSTGKSLYELIKEYRRFCRMGNSTFIKRPMVTWYYLEAQYGVAKEIKNLQKLIATMTASGLNLMRASMDEKLYLLMEIKASIEKMRGIIDHAYWWCSYVMESGFKYYYIWDILNSDVTDEIANGLINQWIQEV